MRDQERAPRCERYGRKEKKTVIMVCDRQHRQRQLTDPHFV